MTLKPSESRPLQALLIALAQSDGLSADVQQQLYQLGQILATHHSEAIETALLNIASLAQQSDRLNSLYQQARTALQTQYQTQERAKSIGSITVDQSWFANLDLLSTAAQVFTDADPARAAHDLFAQRQTTLINWVWVDTDKNFSTAHDRLVQWQPTASGQTIQPNVWEKGDRILVLIAGGAGLGGAVGQLPGAIVGGILAAILAWFTPIASRKQVTGNR